MWDTRAVVGEHLILSQSLKNIIFSILFSIVMSIFTFGCLPIKAFFVEHILENLLLLMVLPTLR